ncbi:hypothetical protein [Exiguobacterium sp. ERU656]|uniref:hypothetical protein n=1 Tax=Exiguobacterium sp. ERU656 TaxID=2751217 RepID=UPI001BEAF52F|nr:hypothetical protein [Exiguobacterium sp. ERU656]
MQLLILSKSEREQLHPMNVVLFFLCMMLTPFILDNESLLITLIVHIFFFASIKNKQILLYLLFPVVYLVAMLIPIVYGYSVDYYSIFTSILQMTLFLTSSQLVMVLIDIRQMGPLFNVFPRTTKLMGMVLALIPSVFRTWPEIKMSHGDVKLTLLFKKIIDYHLITIKNASSKIRFFGVRDFFRSFIILLIFYGIFSEYQWISAILLPFNIIISKGMIRDAYHLYRYRKRKKINRISK